LSIVPVLRHLSSHLLLLLPIRHSLPIRLAVLSVWVILLLLPWIVLWRCLTIALLTILWRDVAIGLLVGGVAGGGRRLGVHKRPEEDRDAPEEGRQLHER